MIVNMDTKENNQTNKTILTYDKDLHNFFNAEGDIATHDEKVQWAKENPEIETPTGKDKVINLKSDIENLLKNVFTETDPSLINDMTKTIIAAAPIKSQPNATPQVNKVAQTGLAGLATLAKQGGMNYGSR